MTFSLSRTLVVLCVSSILSGKIDGQGPALRPESLESASSSPSNASTNGFRPKFQELEGGSVVGIPSQPRWNRVLLLSTPRIDSGATELIPTGVQKGVTRFQLSLVATVQQEQTGGAYRLMEVGVGYSSVKEGKRFCVNTSSAEKLRISLGFFDRNILSENEKQLKQLAVVGSSARWLAFDAPAVFLRNDQHAEMRMRHVVMIDEVSGKLRMAIWLIEKLSDGRTSISPALRIVRENTDEDRKIHVDRSHFFLGIPNAKAFALTDLPPGTPVEIPALFQSIAALDRLGEENFEPMVTWLLGLPVERER